jgi:hypothetical protein
MQAHPPTTVQTMNKLAVIILALLPIACSAQEVPPMDEAEGTPPTLPTAAIVAPTKTVLSAICGHKLDAVGACGNYVEVAGEWHEIADGASHGLGSMEWCGTSDDKVEVEGSVEDGMFVATSLNVIG